EIYSRFAKSVLVDREHVRSEIMSLKELRRGHIRMVSIDGIVAGLLSDTICSFRHDYPGITFQLTSTGTEQVTQAVQSGDADIGVAYQPAPVPDIEVALRIADPLFAVVAPEHELARFDKISFYDILKYPYAIPERTFGIRKLINTFC